MTYFSGRVSAVVYSSGEFYIIKVVLDGSGTTASVRGNFSAQKIASGSWVGFDGDWEDHPSYGKQLAVKRFPAPPPKWTPEIAAGILSANGVGVSTVKVLRSSLGDSLVAALDEGVDALSEVPLDNFSKEHAVNRWRSAVAHLRTLAYLHDSGVPSKIIGKVWSTFGDDASHVLATNPWALLRIDGVTFAQADEVAFKLRIPLTSPHRIKGAVSHALKSARNEGHLFLTFDDIRDAVSKITYAGPDDPPVDFDNLVAELEKDGSCRVDWFDEVASVYDNWSYTLEVDTTEELLRRSAGTRLDKVKAGKELDTWTETSNVQLTDAQRAAALNALTEPVSILTGLPGTGKTTTLRAVVRVLLELGVPFLLCAPTGIAAKRMSSVTNAPAATIHRSFGAKNFKDDAEREATYSGVIGESIGPSENNGVSERWEYDPKNPHPAKVVIVDESSMVDQHLLYRIVRGTSLECRLVFVGDAAQLPSVGPGDVLRQMVSSGIFPVVALTEIFRQAELSGIVVAAHDIHKGHPPSSDGKDFVMIPALNEEAAAATVTQVAEKLYGARKNFQVLSPRHGGAAGVTELNRRLRAALNPGQPGLVEQRIGSDTIREDDRVMITKNDYDLDVYNGDVGKVSRIDRKTKDIEILIHGTIPARQVRIPISDAPSKIRLAYAQTVHKCVHPDTLVETEHGVLPISEIPPTGLIHTPIGMMAYTSKVLRPPDTLLEIKTKDGYSVKVTPDHGMDVWDGMAYGRVEASEIREGSWLRLLIGGASDDKPPFYLEGTAPNTPSSVTPEVAEFFGLMSSGGTIHKNGFYFACRHDDALQRFVELAALLFKVTARRISLGSSLAVEVESGAHAEWLREIGSLPFGNRGVPSAILASGATVWRAYLRGLFEGSTVSITRDRIRSIAWKTPFERCATQIRLMLLRLGIVSRTQVDGQGRHTITIRHPYVDAFRGIGFVSKWQNSRLPLPSNGRENDMVPLSKSEAADLIRYKKKIGFHLCQSAVSNGYLPRSAAALVSAEGGPLAATLQERLRWHHTRVAAIEVRNGPSMCVEVPGEHRFFQDGFSGWNSQGQEYDIIVAPILSSFGVQLQRNLYYTAVTRAKRKAILIGTSEALSRAVLNDRSDKRNTMFARRLRSGSGGQ